jgi:hypothetical protein
VNFNDANADIRLALWGILLDLRAGEIEPEVAEQAISALDSLRELERLESTEVASGGDQGSETGTSVRERGEA